MILEYKQVRRFNRLLDSLFSFLALRLQWKESLMDWEGYVKSKTFLDLAHEVWTKPANLQLIDEYLQLNPQSLSRRDLAEIRSWKEGVFDSFPAVRDGHDMLFLYADLAFAVRGHTREIDEVEPDLPLYAFTLVLPFDGFVTYCGCFDNRPVRRDRSYLAELQQRVDNARTNKLVVSTARSYLRCIDAAKERKLKAKAEEFAHHVELEMNASELTKDQHRGVLAGLSPSERDAAYAAYLEKELSELADGEEVILALTPEATLKAQGPEIETVDDVLGLVDLAVSYRGLAPVTEVLSEVRPFLDHSASWEETITWIRGASDRPRSTFPVRVRGQMYLANKELLPYVSRGPFGELIAGEFIDQLAEDQKSTPPRPVADLYQSGVRSAFDWCMQLDAAHDLVAYFDEHVPNGADDYLFACLAVQQIVACAQIGATFEHVINCLEAEGFFPSEAQLHYLDKAIPKLANMIPLWCFNGWTHLEWLEKQKKS